MAKVNMAKVNMAKVYYVKSTHRNRETIWEGTLEYLKESVFSYTLDCGHSRNKKINPNPKTIKSLITALNKSVYECRRYGDLYEISSKEEFDNSDDAQPMN